MRRRSIDSIQQENASISNQAITLEVREGIAHLVLNRPDEGNPMDDVFTDALEQNTIEIAGRDDVRAVLITSTGVRFSVGGSIANFSSDRAALAPKIRKWNASLHGSISRLARMNAPSVVAVHGTVAGGALSFISGCDIIVSVEKAQFASAYATIGYCPDLGGTTHIARRMGVSRARRFHLLRERLSAQTALDTGLIDFIVPEAELNDNVWTIARNWAQGPTQSFGEIKRLMQSVNHLPLETQMEMETQGITRLCTTDDAWNALNAFMAKRPPVYKGR